MEYFICFRKGEKILVLERQGEVKTGGLLHSVPFVKWPQLDRCYRKQNGLHVFYSMKRLHSGEDDVSRFLKITPKLLCHKCVSRSGKIRCLEAGGMVWNLLSPKPAAQVGEIT